MEIDADTLPVVNNEAARQFEINIEGQVAFLQYRIEGDTIVYPHTVVPRALEHHGLAGRLAHHALEFAKKRHLSVVPICPYVRAYIERHPEYAGLVSATYRKGGI